MSGMFPHTVSIKTYTVVITLCNIDTTVCTWWNIWGYISDYNPGLTIRKQISYSFLGGSAVWQSPLQLCLWLSNLFTFVLMNK